MTCAVTQAFWLTQPMSVTTSNAISDAVEQIYEYGDERHPDLLIKPPMFNDWVTVRSEVHETQEELDEYIARWCPCLAWVDEEYSVWQREEFEESVWYTAFHHDFTNEIMGTLRINVHDDTVQSATVEFTSIE